MVTKENYYKNIFNSFISECFQEFLNVIYFDDMKIKLQKRFIGSHIFIGYTPILTKIIDDANVNIEVFVFQNYECVQV